VPALCSSTGSVSDAAVESEAAVDVDALYSASVPNNPWPSVKTRSVRRLEIEFERVPALCSSTDSVS
jgi:hypothetical protein